jgi:hypothetical protein
MWFNPRAEALGNCAHLGMRFSIANGYAPTITITISAQLSRLFCASVVVQPTARMFEHGATSFVLLVPAVDGADWKPSADSPESDYRCDLWNAARGALPKVPLSRACISLPVLNDEWSVFGTLTDAPVFGLRPRRADQVFSVNIPKPRNSTRSPLPRLLRSRQKWH